MASKDSSECVPASPDDQDECDSKGQYHFQLPVTGDRIGAVENDPGKRNPISCNFCRRRKIKCDRANPCNQCRISFNDCVYPERSRRRGGRTTAKRIQSSSERIDHLERRLKAIESNQIHPQPATALYVEATPSIPTQNASLRNPPPVADAAPYDKPAPAEFGKCATAYHSIEQGEIEFNGYSADRSFMQGMGEKLGDWSAPRRKLPPDLSVPGLFHVDTRYSEDVPLPTRDWAMRLVDSALDAQILLCVIHRPSFDVSFNLIYSLEPSEYSLREKRFLPLLYAVLAYGSLFVDPYAEKLRYDELIAEASRYYAKSKQLQDIAICNDLTSLQAILFMNLFLLFTSRVSICYTYLSTTLSISLRMGLHRSLNTAQDMISQEIGKRIFWALKVLSNDVAACLGLPRLLSDEDIDQELPTEVNDAYIQRGGISKQPQNQVCYVSGAISYARLQKILNRVIKEMYPQKGLTTTPIRGSMSYAITLETIRGLEGDLENWAKNIPWGFRLGTYYKERGLQRAQYVLCMSYSYIQLCLYRPFLHYGIEDPEQPKHRGKRFSSCASACIQACQNIIALCDDMCKRGLLTEASWPATRLLFSCILTLLYIIIMSRDPPEVDALFKDLATGRKVLNHLEKRGFQARRCQHLLKIMTSTLPADFDHIRERLANFETEVPDVIQCDLSSINDSYTAFLGERSFSLSSQPPVRVNSRPSTAEADTQTNGSDAHLSHNRLKYSEEPYQLPPLSFSTQMKQMPVTVAADAPASLASSVFPNPRGSVAPACSETYHTPELFTPSVPGPVADNILEARPLEFHPESSGGTWLHAFDKGYSRDGAAHEYSGTALLGTVGLYMDDANDLSDIWLWF